MAMSDEMVSAIDHFAAPYGRKVTLESVEYETGLLIKSAAFTASGIALIVAGVMFEKYLKKRRLADE